MNFANKSFDVPDFQIFWGVQMSNSLRGFSKSVRPDPEISQLLQAAPADEGIFGTQRPPHLMIKARLGQKGEMTYKYVSIAPALFFWLTLCWALKQLQVERFRQHKIVSTFVDCFYLKKPLKT